jgi:mono/diheme cytochrome c family protein
MIKKAFSVLVAVFLIIQLIRPAKNLSPSPGPQDITAKVAVPAEVQHVFAKACYDCHSDRTRYPWYAEVQPVGWWLASHIHDGKQHLNFSEFGAYNAKTADRRLKQVARNVDNREMPLPSYRWLHRDAILTDAEIKLIDDWVEAARSEIAPKPPAK